MSCKTFRKGITGAIKTGMIHSAADKIRNKVIMVIIIILIIIIIILVLDTN